MSEIKWSKIIEQIKNIKYPLSFFYRIIVVKDQINDYELGIIFSHYLNYHLSICFDNPLFLIALDLKESHPYSWKVLNNFYSSCYYIILSSVNLISFRICYKKKFFWKLSNDNKLDYINNKIKQINAIFDTSFSSNPFYLKYRISMKRKKNQQTLLEMANRLQQIYKLFGFKFFQIYQIKLLTLIEFKILNIKDQVNYASYIFKTIISILNSIYKNLELFTSHSQRLKNIINPVMIDIDIGTDSVNSETDFEELCYF
jgi:hypothetical protein